MEVKKELDIKKQIIELIRNIKEMEEAIASGKSVIKLDAEFCTPIAILPIAAYADKHNLKISLEKVNNRVRSFLKQISFPKGQQKVPRLKQAYLPILKLRTDVNNKVLNKFENVLMSKVNDSSLLNNIKFLTSELSTNIIQHSKADEYWIRAQYYKKTRICQIALIDMGIGIKASYCKTPYKVKSHQQAIKQAIKGISSKKSNERGSGIPSTIKLISEGFKGDIILMSGNALFHISKKDIFPYVLPINWPGTFAFLKFPTNRDFNFYDCMI